MAVFNNTLLNGFLSLAGVCCVLLACRFPFGSAEPATANGPQATRLSSLTPSPSPTGTSASVSPTAVALRGESDNSPDLYVGCWRYEGEDVSFEMRLRQRQQDVQGTFPLIKICVVGDLESACRIREGEITGREADDGVEARVLVPEYEDDGVALLTLGEWRDVMFWEEVEYPWAGLADGNSRYLPARFVLDVCDG